MRSLVTCLVVLALAGSAVAQPGATEPIPPGAEEPIPPPPSARISYAPTSSEPIAYEPPKSEDTALWLSLGGTLASYGLVVGGVAMGRANNTATNELAGSLGSLGLVGTFLAPTFGHWYAGKGFTRGFALRIGGVGAGIVGLFVAIAGCPLFYGSHDDQSSDSCGNPVAGGVIALLGVGMYVGGTVDDIVQAPRRVRRLNAERSFTVMPLLDRDSGGLALVGQF